MSDDAIKLADDPSHQQPGGEYHFGDLPPLQLDQEWANALTHGIGAVLTLVAGVYLLALAGQQSVSLLLACLVYITATLGTYFFSTLSHMVRRQPLLNRMRAWDQAMIYMMIAGTYTPLVVRFAADPVRVLLLSAMWSAAAIGFLSKVAIGHRINSTGTISYLLLGYVPAVVLASQVPTAIALWMVAGGIVYSIGVVFLINDAKLRYLHAGWHLMVIIASTCHYVGMLEVITT